MSTNYDVLFTPFKIGKLELKNRIVLSPHGTGSGEFDGTKSEYELNYYIERAKGGAGMIITGVQFLSQKWDGHYYEGYLNDLVVVPKLNSFTENCHRWGCKVAMQISPGTGRNALFDKDKSVPISSSATPAYFDPNIKCKPMSSEDIKEMLDAIAFGAKIALCADFDAIEIHAHAGYLLDQFFTPAWNLRTDEYGGSAKNRVRLAAEMIQTIRGVVGPDFPILFRVALDHRYPGLRTLEDSMPILEELEKAGVDALDIDAGCYETLDYIFPTAYVGDNCMSYVCKEARKHVKVPLLNAGGHTPESAVALIESGDADLVMFARGLIADPQMPNKLLKGHREDVKPCIRCLEGCIGRQYRRLTKNSCSVNPRACEEARLNYVPAKVPKNIVVIGAGPAGLEAAQAAAFEGHNVTIFDHRDYLGGNMQVISSASWKHHYRELIRWYETQFKKLGVKVMLNHDLDLNDPLLELADYIFIGAGANPFLPPIPGIEKTVNILDAHKDASLLKGDKIIVCGGGESGCDGALEYAMDMGKKAVIIEMQEDVAMDAMFINKLSLKRFLNEYGVEQITNAKVVKMTETTVTYEKDGKLDTVEGTTVVNAFGTKANREFVDLLQTKYNKKLRIMGDCAKVARTGDAIRAGYYAAISIDPD